MRSLSSFSALSLLVASWFSLPVTGSILVDPTTVKLNYGTFQGASSTDGTVQFLGIPYAAPPVGNLRFAAPQNPISFEGVRQATTYGAACPQAAFGGGPGGPPTVNDSEDCLFVNVVKPANIAPDKKLPVLFWIYGGAFQAGESSFSPGGTVVNRSIALDQPVVFVSINYRVNGFGFLGGAEIKAAKLANAGLRDQRFALQWVQKYIEQFGGDSDKVTIWGESAGAISVGLQMLLDDGNTQGLFRGGYMQSGSPFFLPDILSHQVYFDQLVSLTNCTTASDKIHCLRGVPYDQLKAAIAIPSAGNSMRLTYQPLTDGDLIVRDPYISVKMGKYARIPFVTGDCEDEGTLFTLGNTNITTNAEFLDFVKTNYLPSITDDQLTALSLAYPEDPAQGSPFNTGTENAISPQYKRLAAFHGDLVFQAPRRYFLSYAAKTQPTYAFRYLKGFGTPVVGVNHASDISFFFGAGINDTNGVDSLIYFTATLDPNGPLNRNFHWPLYQPQNRALMTFTDADPPFNITLDTYRDAPMNLLNDIELGQIGHGV